MQSLINNIVCADCESVLRSLPDNFADLLLTDPPYGIGADAGVGGFGAVSARRYQGDWDSSTPSSAAFEQMLRVSKDQIIFGGNYFTDKLPCSTRWLVWDKVGDIPFKNPYSDAELVWTSLHGVRVNKYTVVQQGFVSDDKAIRIHPTQKPVALICRMLEDFTQPGALVLDPYSGSGSVACACHITGRRFVAIERDPTYHAASLARLEALRAQLLLPLPSAPAFAQF